MAGAEYLDLARSVVGAVQALKEDIDKILGTEEQPCDGCGLTPEKEPSVTERKYHYCNDCAKRATEAVTHTAMADASIVVLRRKLQQVEEDHQRLLDAREHTLVTISDLQEENAQLREDLLHAEQVLQRANAAMTEYINGRDGN